MVDPSQTTRNEILRFIKTKGSADAKAIAQWCGLTTMAVRRHLLKLQGESLIESGIERRPKGRPTTLYRLTGLGDAAFPRDYEGLACDVLWSLRDLDGEDKVGQVLRKRRAQMTARYLRRMKRKNLEKRVREMAAILTESGYMADATPQTRGGFLLTERNCAIPQIAKRFPVVCEEELCFIRQLVAADVTRVSHLLAGACHCSYRIQHKGASANTPVPIKPEHGSPGRSR